MTQAAKFDDIVARLTAGYPSLARMPGTPWPRPVLISVLVAGALAWGLLSILMVVWGWRGVVLTAAVVLLVAAVGAYRSRYR